MPNVFDAYPLHNFELHAESESLNVVGSSGDLVIKGPGYFIVRARISAAEITIPEGYTDEVVLSFQCKPHGAAQPIATEGILTHGVGRGRISGTGDWRYPDSS